MVGDQHRRRRVRVQRPTSTAGPAGPRGRPGPARPPARRAAAAPGRSSTPGRSAPACARPRTACRTCAPASPRTPMASSSCVGPGGVGVLVALPPAAQHPVAGADHHVAHDLVAGHPQPQPGRGEADPGAQLEHVDPAEPLAQHVHHAHGRVQFGRRPAAAGWSCRRRWVRAPPSVRPARRPSRPSRSSVELPRRTPTPSIRRTRSVRSGGSLSADRCAVNNDSDGRFGGDHGPILADRAGLPVGCPCRSRRGALRRRLDQRRRRRGVPGRRLRAGADRTPGRADRAHLRRLARARPGHRPRPALRLPGARAVPAVGRACGRTRPRSSSTRTRAGSPAGSPTWPRPAAGWTTR